MSENVFEIRDLKDYTILIPNMAPNQFTLIQAALLSEGYHVELMSKASSQVAQLGLQISFTHVRIPRIPVSAHVYE